MNNNSKAKKTKNTRIKKIGPLILEATGSRLCSAFMFKKGSASLGWFFSPSKVHLVINDLSPQNDFIETIDHMKKCESIIKYLRILKSQMVNPRKKKRL